MPCTPAPWRDLFLRHISSIPQSTFVLSTLQRPSSAGPPVPRARTCVFRGLWGSLPPNERNAAPRNPPVYESDLPVFTTDVRMGKAGEIAGADDDKAAAGSGGGGPVEAVFWAEEFGTQWRVRGTAWVLGPDMDRDEGEGGARRVRDVLLERMRAGGPVDGWSWAREVTGHFGNLSPAMRGTFRNPPPGVPIQAGAVPGEGLGLGQTVEDLEDRIARENFRVVVIVPTEIDQADLSDPKRPRRWLWVFRGASYKNTMPGGEVVGEWERVEVWP
ncbi:hypothetical protein B0T22DRAFT_376105 [Podospora appendiculata]|uniref:Pyridoxamine 5'-phosphate oxidase Alr4036 family FMN-binding domain-containing protein n=1 Tax=Podospora appendiculata TaxID=314037 RepID=A0AAE0X8T0_9PEZI|nr:hypothetical protein B0T22DRAFT_376105 [Podospora appendiculata]